MIPLSATGTFRQSVPIVSITLIAINAVVFLYELSLDNDRILFVYKFGLIPSEITTELTTNESENRLAASDRSPTY